MRRNPYKIEHVMERDACSEEEARLTIVNLKKLTTTGLDTFIRKYGEELGTIKFKEKCEKSSHTKKKFIEKYGEELGHEKWTSYVESKDSASKQYFQDNFDEDWEELYKERTNNSNLTLDKFIEKYGEELGVIRYNRMNEKRSYSCSKKGLIEKFGEEETKIICSAKSITKEKLGPLRFKEKLESTRKAMESVGLWLPLEHVNDKEYYKRLVISFTNKQDVGQLLHCDRRGRADLTTNAYHLDHKISIVEGFKQGILPSIIGDINNLQFLPHVENIKKYNKCYSAIRRENEN